MKEKNSASGQILTLFVLAIVALCGFAALAIDFGMLSLNANRSQIACDMAALSGAEKLDGTTSTTNAAYIAATNMAYLNNYTLSPSNIAFPSAANTQISVSAPKTQGLFFGRVIGVGSSTITRSATAEKSGIVISSMTGAVPLAITTNAWSAHKGGDTFSLTLCRNQDSAFTDANFLALSMQTSSGDSIAKYETNLKYGTQDRTLTTADSLRSMNASSQESKTHDGIQYRMDQNQKTVAIIITDPVATEVHGVSMHPVRRIVMAELISDTYDKHGSTETETLTLRILQITSDPTAGATKTITNLASGSSYVVRLIN